MLCPSFCGEIGRCGGSLYDRPIFGSPYGALGGVVFFCRDSGDEYGGESGARDDWCFEGVVSTLFLALHWSAADALVLQMVRRIRAFFWIGVGIVMLWNFKHEKESMSSEAVLKNGEAGLVKP